MSHMPTPAQKQATALKQLRTIVASGGAAMPKKSDYALPKQYRENAEDINQKLLQQKHDQRADILKFIEDMAAASFIFLVVIILWQMVTREVHPNYTGVSDTVINILAVSVFGQVLGIVAAITAQVWKAPKDTSPKS